MQHRDRKPASQNQSRAAQVAAQMSAQTSAQPRETFGLPNDVGLDHPDWSELVSDRDRETVARLTQGTGQQPVAPQREKRDPFTRINNPRVPQSDGFETPGMLGHVPLETEERLPQPEVLSKGSPQQHEAQSVADNKDVATLGTAGTVGRLIYVAALFNPSTAAVVGFVAVVAIAGGYALYHLHSESQDWQTAGEPLLTLPDNALDGVGDGEIEGWANSIVQSEAPHLLDVEGAFDGIASEAADDAVDLVPGGFGEGPGLEEPINETLPNGQNPDRDYSQEGYDLEAGRDIGREANTTPTQEVQSQIYVTPRGIETGVSIMAIEIEAAYDIAYGHGWSDHQSDWIKIGVNGPQELAEHLEYIMANPSDYKELKDGRRAYWDDATGTVIIENPNETDRGTAFVPPDGRDFFDRLGEND